jgi:hypothetical protein
MKPKAISAYLQTIKIPACSASRDSVVSEDRRLAKGNAPEGGDHRAPHGVHTDGTPQARHQALAIHDAQSLTGLIEDEARIARYLPRWISRRKQGNLMR